jgi:glyoxylate reductase
VSFGLAINTRKFFFSRVFYRYETILLELIERFILLKLPSSSIRLKRTVYCKLNGVIDDHGQPLGNADFKGTRFMNKPSVLVTCPLFPEIKTQLEQHFTLHLDPKEDIFSEAELIKWLQHKQAVFTSSNARFTAQVLERAQDLKIICAMTVGYDNIDVAACQARGIVVTHAPGVLTQTTADFAWALLLATARRVTESERWLRAGHWKQWLLEGFLGADVYGKTLGILGMGQIGQAIARRSIGFDMKVIYHNRSRLSEAQEANANNARYVSKQELLENADHVVVMVPYSTSTHHAIGDKELQLMQKSATLIHLARGGVVDDTALITALRHGEIAAAGLDVFEHEPKFNPEFLELPNVVLTPHIASASRPTRHRMQQCAANNLMAFFECGEAINVVTS